jgi:uncharacterized protein
MFTKAGLVMELSASDVVRLLALQPHPEGGYYRETFRDKSLVASNRAASTAIYFLLAEGQVSRWHRIDAAEVWHWYAGASLCLHMAERNRPNQMRLGRDLIAGERPQAVVPAGCWQMAESLGAWTLVGCTVAPGFAFSAFEAAPEGWSPSA